MSVVDQVAPFALDELSGTTDEGEHVAIWRMAARGERVGAVALVPGFCRRMRHMAPIAAYLASSGLTVYRCDAVNHVGLSEGEVESFTMSSMARALSALLEVMAEEEDADAFGVIAASLSMRAAIRAAVSDPAIAAVIGMVGVVHARRTLHVVFGEDYAALALDELPGEYAVFEDKRIGGRNFLADFYDANWGSLESTIEDLREQTTPVLNYCASNDDWVDIEDVRVAFEQGAGGRRRIIELPFAEHELTKNPVAGQLLLDGMTEEALAIAGAAGSELRPPPFEELAAQSIFERRFEADRLRERQEPATRRRMP